MNNMQWFMNAKCVFYKKESNFLRAQMKIVTNSSKLFEFICKHKDYIWLGNFGLHWKVQSIKYRNKVKVQTSQPC